MIECVRLLVLTFYIKGPVHTEEARKILLASIQCYLNEINTDEKIRQYLVEYPFPLKNIELNFITHMEKEDIRKSNSLASFATFSGRIIYEKLTDTGRLYVDLEETFEEAQEKLNVQK